MELFDLNLTAIAIARWPPRLPKSRDSAALRRLSCSGQGEAGRIEPPFRLGMRGCNQGCTLKSWQMLQFLSFINNKLGVGGVGRGPVWR